MAKKNFGPCSIENCTYYNIAFRQITELAYQKCQETNMLATYPYLEKGKQLCHPHYCAIVEFKHNQNKHKRKKKSKNQEGSRKKTLNNVESQLLNRTTNEGNIIKLI